MWTIIIIISSILIIVALYFIVKHDKKQQREWDKQLEDDSLYDPETGEKISFEEAEKQEYNELDPQSLVKQNAIIKEIHTYLEDEGVALLRSDELKVEEFPYLDSFRELQILERYKPLYLSGTYELEEKVYLHLLSAGNHQEVHLLGVILTEKEYGHYICLAEDEELRKVDSETEQDAKPDIDEVLGTAESDYEIEIMMGITCVLYPHNSLAEDAAAFKDFLVRLREQLVIDGD